MGVSWSLHLIDPQRYERVVADLANRPIRSAADVEAVLDTFSVDDQESRDSILARFEGVFEKQRWLVGAKNHLLSRLVTFREWDLGTSLSTYHGLGVTLEALPALRPIRIFVDFSGSDIDVPRTLSSPGEGLFMIWSAALLGECVEVANHFATQHEATEYYQSLTWSFLDRLFRRPDRAKAGFGKWILHWDSWRDIREAVRMTVEQEKLLGLSLFP